jgi:hypothetical protein
MLQTTSLALVLVLALGPACSKKSSDRTRKLAALCVEASDQLGRNAGSADPDTFQMMLSNALMACSAACDGDDAASCTQLDGHVRKVCGVAPGMCASLCGSVKSPSLKRATCGFAK